MESNQLKNIQNIQNSLVLLKFKIQNMAKVEDHNQNSLHQIFQNAIPIVQKKIQEKNQVDNIQLKKSQLIGHLSQIRKKNQQSRIINEKQVSRSKQIVSLMKQHNSLHLKQSTKKNEEKIKKIKQLNLLQKREKKMLIKQKEQEAQIKIQDFYNHKQQELRLLREKEKQNNQEKIKELALKMKELYEKQNKMEEKVKYSNQNINRFKTIIKKVDKMKIDEFENFKRHIKTGSKIQNSKEIVQGILVYATENSI